MKGRNSAFPGLWASLLPLSVCCSAAIIVDTSPGTGAPPGTLGGYSMVAFPDDPTPEGTMITQLAPPPTALVTGNLEFATEDGLGVEHMLVGPSPRLWDTWSHGYTGDLYFNADNDLLLFHLPLRTMAFSMNIQPNLKDDFEFVVFGDRTFAVLDINGNGGARYVGFYSNTADPLDLVYIRQTSEDSDGFAVGEFMINGIIPEPGTWAGLTALGLGVWALARRRLA